MYFDCVNNFGAIIYIVEQNHNNNVQFAPKLKPISKF